MNIGSLFSGYGGLCELAVAPLLGGTVAWHCEVDKDASRILDHHWPDTPNLGDITAVDWVRVEPVDVLTGGFPCQDLSHAGKRLGLKPGTRSGLWSHMAYAIGQLRPALVVIENVRGILSAPAHSDLEPCPWCLGDGQDGALRALGAVLGDLAGLGYDARWAGVRASDTGAPHGRFRVFVVAHPASNTGRQQHRDRGATANPRGIRREPWRTAGPGEAAGGWPLSEPAGRGLLPTPRATDGTKGGPNQRGSAGDLMLPSAVTLLPTPVVYDMGDGKTPEVWDEWTAKMQAAHGDGNGHGKSLAIEAQRLLPTPEAADGSGGRASSEVGGTRPSGVKRAVTLGTVTAPAHADRWGIYAEAIARWESLTRPAPAPTQPSTKGTPQLAPRFNEWMMGLPEGHVTAVPGLSRNAQLKALGNGVVPQQAALALSLLLSDGRYSQVPAASA